MPQNSSGLKWLWLRVGDISLAVWLLNGFLSLLATWRGTSAMPATWTSPQMWSAAGAIFVGSLAVSTLATKGILLGIPMYKRWKSPHSIVVIPRGGLIATIELKHYGEPAFWIARGRIRQMMTQGAPNPSPLLVLYNLRKDGRVHEALELRNQQAAHVELARIRHSQWGNRDTWLDVNGSAVPDEGAIVEVEITAEPPLPTGIERRCYKIVRNRGIRRFRDILEAGNPDVIEIEEMPCD